MTRAEFVDILVKALQLKGSRALSYSDAAQIPTGLHDSVATAVANGLLSGYPDGTLRANDLLTRAQAAALFDRALKLVPVAVQNKGLRLKDADSLPAWAASAIQNVVTHGLIMGYDDGAFHPDEYLTRAQIAVIVERYMQRLAKP